MLNKTKTILAGIACGLVGLFCVSAGMQLWAKDEFKPSNWGKRNVEQTEEIPEDEVGDNVIVSDNGNENSPLKLTMSKVATVATAVDSGHTSYKITATMTPSNTTDKLDMVLSGTDASKITLDHEDGAFEATVTVNEAFSNTVTLTATVRNRSISQSIKLDYLSKPESLPNYTVNDITDDADFDASMFYYTTGSVKPTRLVGTVTFLMDTKLYNKLKDKGWTDLGQSYTFWYDGSTDTNDCVGFCFDCSGKLFTSSALDSEREKAFRYDLYSSLCELFGFNFDTMGVTESVGTVQFDGTAYYMVNGVETDFGEFSTVGSPCSFKIKSFSGLSVPTADVDLGGDIVFGG